MKVTELSLLCGDLVTIRIQEAFGAKRRLGRGGRGRGGGQGVGASPFEGIKATSAAGLSSGRAVSHAATGEEPSRGPMGSHRCVH